MTDRPEEFILRNPVIKGIFTSASVDASWLASLEGFESCARRHHEAAIVEIVAQLPALNPFNTSQFNSSDEIVALRRLLYSKGPLRDDEVDALAAATYYCRKQADRDRREFMNAKLGEPYNPTDQPPTGRAAKL